MWHCSGHGDFHCCLTGCSALSCQALNHQISLIEIQIQGPCQHLNGFHSPSLLWHHARKPGDRCSVTFKSRLVHLHTSLSLLLPNCLLLRFYRKAAGETATSEMLAGDLVSKTQTVCILDLTTLRHNNLIKWWPHDIPAGEAVLCLTILAFLIFTIRLERLINGTVFFFFLQ